MAGNSAAEADMTGDVPPTSKIRLFLGILLAGAVAFALVFLAIDLPTCEDPEINWVPCIGP